MSARGSPTVRKGITKDMESTAAEGGSVSRAEALASAFADATSKPAKRLAAGLGGPPSDRSSGWAQPR